MALVQQSLNNLTDAYTTERNTKLLALASDLVSSISDVLSDDLWEQAWLKILEIAIKRGQDIELDTTDRNSLLAIANSCPDDVGVAAQGVVAYMQAEDGHPFLGRESWEDCASEERGSNPEYSISIKRSTVLFPNPANNTVTVALDISSGGKWKVWSSTGKVMDRGMYVQGEGALSLDVARYPSGLYLLQIQSLAGKRFSQKFSVVR